MERFERCSCDLSSLALRFCYDLCEELEYHRKSRRYLTLEESKILRAYYSHLNFNTVKHFAYSEARLLIPVIKYIMSCAIPPRILDTGCGLGSHAIFFSLFDAEVVGVDLSKERLDVANRRIKYYEEKHNKSLNVRFHLKNVLKSYELGKFDVVWSNQSISHIHPVEDFLHAAWRNLENGGCLFICDSNGMNPYVAIKAWLVHRKGGLYKLVRDPETGELIPYARERMLNPLYLKASLSKSDYSIQMNKSHVFAHPKLNASRLFRFIDDLLMNMPILRLVGGNYIIVGKKIAGNSG